jgi:hypothetical protein
MELSGNAGLWAARVRRSGLPGLSFDQGASNVTLTTLHTSTHRVRYPHLPRRAWPELHRLKREGSFSDLPCEPRPNSPALMRSVRDERSGRTILSIVIVGSDGRVHRFSETITPLKPLPRVR